jgi:hypothetical protein
MNRTDFRFLFFIASLLLVAACAKEKKGATPESNTWAEMDDFHMVMAETFHPYKDSADLAPVKSQAKDLVEAADKWSQSALPDRVDNDEMKTKLQQLKSECEALADVVQVGDDNAIGAQLTKVHNLFHEIQELWYAKGSEHHHDH